MSTPILATKLYIPPPLPKGVRRPRLLERLNEGLELGRRASLTLISAPAGFGKTTLVSEWLHQNNGVVQPARAAWLSLDEADNELTRFLAYLVAALQTVAPQLGDRVWRALHAPQPPTTEATLTLLLNDITTLTDNYFLVLDDYHVIEARPINHALTFLLEHLPPQLHLVIATREDPPLPLARLRARHQLTELRAADLRFTTSEAAGFLNQMMGLKLPVEAIAALETRTEGWIAGLQLAAISMRGHQDAARFIQSFTGSHRFVMDYLVEEVLQQQPQTLQTFLLHTAILNRLCGPLCDAVLGDPAISGQATLESIEQANLFIIPLDNERRWYRYHHLFADLLRQRLASTPGGDNKQVAELHLRASLWYEENGLEGEAIHHALAAKDFERAAALVELAWPAMDGRFQAAAWLGWVSALPEALVRARPVLNVAYAWALLDRGELEAGAARLAAAERWLQPDRPAGMVVVDEAQFRFLPASIATARAYIAQAYGDGPGTITYARQALDLLAEEDHIRRGVAAALLGLAYWAGGNLEAAHRTLTDGMASFQKGGNLHFALSGTYGLADIRIAQGRLREAFNTYQQALQLVAAQGEPFLRGTADLYLGLGDLHREQGDLEAAAQHLLQSEALSEQAALPHWQYRICVAQARLKETQGDLAGALDRLDEAERLYIRGPVPDVRPIAALKARVWVAQGKLAQALAWAREQELTVDDPLSYLREFEHITLARIRLAQYRRDRRGRFVDETLSLLARLLQTAEEGGRTGSVIELLILQALAHQAQGNLAQALPPLARALNLAEPEGYLRLFVDEGQPMAALLSEAAARGITPAYTNRLLAAFPTALPTGPSQSLAQMVEPLSQRELEVLQLVAQGLSNREISERLFLALSTVKGYNRTIFGKLQVQRRTEAVARARELGLL